LRVERKRERGKKRRGEKISDNLGETKGLRGGKGQGRRGRGKKKKREVAHRFEKGNSFGVELQMPELKGGGKKKKGERRA